MRSVPFFTAHRPTPTRKGARSLILGGVLMALAACEPGYSAADNGVRVGGSVAVGVSTGGEYGADRFGTGPAPGRTAQERQARKDYYRGPRGDRF